jgi:hypothetical protein
MARRRTPPNRKPVCTTLWGSHGCKKATRHSGDCICSCNARLADFLAAGGKVLCT